MVRFWNVPIDSGGREGRPVKLFPDEGSFGFHEAFIVNACDPPETFLFRHGENLFTIHHVGKGEPVGFRHLKSRQAGSAQKMIGVNDSDSSSGRSRGDKVVFTDTEEGASGGFSDHSLFVEENSDSLYRFVHPEVFCIQEGFRGEGETGQGIHGIFDKRRDAGGPAFLFHGKISFWVGNHIGRVMAGVMGKVEGSPDPAAHEGFIFVDQPEEKP